VTGEAFAWPSIMLIGPAAGCTFSVGVALVWIASMLVLEAGGKRRMIEGTAKVLLAWGIFCLAVFAMLIVYAAHESLFTQRVRI